LADLLLKAYILKEYNSRPTRLRSDFLKRAVFDWFAGRHFSLTHDPHGSEIDTGEGRYVTACPRAVPPGSRR